MQNYDTSLTPISDLRPHPSNYRDHPPDQLEHIKASIQEHGFYRNVVVAQDNTILAGHGVVEACQELGIESIPVVRLPIDPESSQAAKVLTGDNAIGRLALDDDRALTSLLKELAGEGDLLGTGYDDEMVAALAHLSESSEDLERFNPNTEWVGMPTYVNEDQRPVRQLIVSFATSADAEDFAGLLGTTITDKTKSIWWPPQERLSGIDRVYDAD